MRIHFRSKFSKHNGTGTSLQKRKHNGTDWEGIRPYNSSSDARHIFWKKSTHYIVEKTFEENASISLICFYIKDDSDDFSDWKSPSRTFWRLKTQKIIEENTKNSQVFLDNFFIESLADIDQISQKYQIKNSLILIFSHKMGEDFSENENKFLEKIANFNEIIWISCFHPFEKTPDDSLLLEWKLFVPSKQSKYQQIFEKFEQNIKKSLAKYSIFYISTDTTKSIDTVLNDFFKYHYEKQ